MPVAGFPQNHVSGKRTSGTGDMDGGIWLPISATVGSATLALLGGVWDWAFLLCLSSWPCREAVIGALGVASWPVKTITLVAVPLVSAMGLVVLVRGLLDRSVTGSFDLGRPALFRCKTTHRRMFPKKHAFAYSYLVAGVPVGWKGEAGGMLSVDETRGASRGGGGIIRRILTGRWTWFVVWPEDHMQRGSHERGLRGKLDDFLEREGVDLATYPYAYLVTVPRLLGYSFNPVSFWYLYGPKRDLQAVICEVNNTFDERRPYLLTRGAASSSSSSSSSATADVDDSSQDDMSHKTTAAASPPTKLLRHTWPKDFHVSPFNSRKGAYSILARDPLRGEEEEEEGGRGKGGTEVLGRVDNTLTLTSSKGRAKVIARLFSDAGAEAGAGAAALDPAAMNPLAKARLLASWGWVVFVTVPRILREAGALFSTCGLHVWYRPEPLGESMGRRADPTERRLEPLFREYLRHLVDGAGMPLRVTYVPSGCPDAATEIMVSSSAAATAAAAAAAASNSGGSRQGGEGGKAERKEVQQNNQHGGPDDDDDDDNVQSTEFRVLTPAFYGRFVRYAHDFEAVFCELRESATVTVSNPSLLPAIFVRKTPPVPLGSASVGDLAYVTAAKALRRRPDPIVRPLTSSSSSCSSSSIPLSSTTATASSTAAAGSGSGTRAGRAAATPVDIRGFRLSSMDGYMLGKAAKRSRRAYRSVMAEIFAADLVAWGDGGMLWAEVMVVRLVAAWFLAGALGPLMARAFGA